MGKVEAAFQPWLKEVTDRKLSLFGGKLAIPLRYKYTKGNLSFAALKGKDSIVAELLKESKDQNGDKWLELHLCLVTKHLVNENDGDYREEEIKIKNWIPLNDNPGSVAFEKLDINMEMEAVVEAGGDPFCDEPDEEEYEKHTGNAGPKLEQWYHKAMLVVWPKAISISVACEAGLPSAIDRVESIQEVSGPYFRNSLHQIICFCETHPSQVWQAKEDSTPTWQRGDQFKEDAVTPRLVNLCIKASMPDNVLRILQVLAKTFYYKPYDHSKDEQPFKVSARNGKVAKVIASAVQVFKWDLFSSAIIDLVNQCALTQGESFAELAKQLIIVGIEDAGTLVAESMFKVFETLIANLESHKMPEFSWRQPQAKLAAYSEVESFLRGPQEKYDYTGIKGLPAMRTFAETHFNKYGDHSERDGYSATGTPGGQGQRAYCIIQKTRRIYEKKLEQWREEQERMNRLKVELGKLRSVVPQTKAVNMTSFVNTSESGKKQKRYTGGTGDRGKRAKSSAAPEIIDLDQ